MNRYNLKGEVPDWCPGCGNFGIQLALKKAFANLNLDPKEVVLVSGIGCSSKTPQWVGVNGFHTLHGRPLPVAEGIKLANKNLHVVVVTGDGDMYGEGISHLIQGIRDNVNVTVLVNNNSVYSLTKGQASPTQERSKKNLDYPLNPLSLAISQDCSYVARSYSGNVKHLAGIIEDAMKFEGFALVDIFQICKIFNPVNTPEWFKEKLYEVDHDPSDMKEALDKSFESEKLGIGVFYKKRKELFEEGHPTLKKGNLVD